MNRETVEAVKQEATYAHNRWGDTHHEVGGWILLMERFLERARAAWCGASNDTQALHEIRKVAQLATTCMDQHGALLRPLVDFDTLERMR